LNFAIIKVKFKQFPLIDNLVITEPRKVETSEVINIVLAEDDIDDVFIFQLALNELKIDCKLNHALNGENLLALLKDLIPDIIFLDINIPCKDGLSCLREIRKNSTFDNVPVVLISGHNSSKYINDAFSNRANYYLIKANNLGRLVENLTAIFSIDWKKVMYYPPINQFVIGNMEGAA
jgi:DNA-binding response OmpR family regulator